MESNDKHILDKQLHDKLYDQEVAPPDFAWDNIEEELNGNNNSKHPFIFKRFIITTAITVSIALLSTFLYWNKTHNNKSIHQGISTNSEKLNALANDVVDHKKGVSKAGNTIPVRENAVPIQKQDNNRSTNQKEKSGQSASNHDKHLSGNNTNQNKEIGLPSVNNTSSLPIQKEASELHKHPQISKEKVALNAPLLGNEKLDNLISTSIKANKDLVKTNQGKVLKKNIASQNDLHTGFEKDNTMASLAKLDVNDAEKTPKEEVQSKKVPLNKINSAKTQSQNKPQSQGFKNKKNTKEIATNVGTTETGLIDKENTNVDGVANTNKVTTKKNAFQKSASHDKPHRGKKASYNQLKTVNSNATETGFKVKENVVIDGSTPNQQGNTKKLNSPKITNEQTPIKALETNQIDQTPQMLGAVKAGEETKSDVPKSNNVSDLKEPLQAFDNSKSDSKLSNTTKNTSLDSSKVKQTDAVALKSKDSLAVKKSKLKISPNGVVFQMLYNQPNFANLNGTSTASNLTSALTLNSKSFLASLLYNTSIHPLIDINVGLSYQYNTVTVAQHLTTVKTYNDTTHRFFDSLVVVGVDTFGNPKYANQQFNKMIITEKSEESNTNNAFQNQYAYLGVPLEVIFKKNISHKLQFMALVGFRMQFLAYKNLAEANTTSKVTVASQLFNYYGSVGLGYKLTDKFTLTAALNMANVSAGQVSIYNNNSISKVVFSPELRCSWFIF